MGEEQKSQNPTEVLAAINRVTKEKGIQRITTTIPSAPSVRTPQSQPVVLNQAPSVVELEDQSDDQDGTVFLLWFDNEDAQRYPPGQQSGIYPMKSAFYLSKYVDYHNEEEKQNALQQIAGVVELFENDSPEVRSRGKYAIIIGKMVQVEVQKKIVLK